MRSRHVEVDGQCIHVRFKGKGGKEHTFDAHDRRLARVVQACDELPGQFLFQFSSEGGTGRIRSDDINCYLREVGGGDFTAKDFRTWSGPVLAAVFLAEAEPAASTAKLRRTVNDAARRVAAELGNTPTICKKVLPPSGAVRTLSLHARRVALEGNPVTVVSASDTTRLREAERTIREGQERVLAFLDAIPANIIATDLGGKPTFINRHWLEFTGQSRDEALKHGTAPLIHVDDLANATEAWAEALRTGNRYEIEHRVLDRFGEFRWQTFRIEPVQTDAGLVSWIGVSVDVNETRQLRAKLEDTVAQLADAMESKDEVLGLISHELRTPLDHAPGQRGLPPAPRRGDRERESIVADIAADTRRL